MTPRSLGARSGAVAVAATVLLGLATVGPAAARQAPAAKAKPAAPKPAPKKEAPKDPIGADEIALRDGKVLLGQVYDPSPRGMYLVLVRRAWAEANLPGWAARWKLAEAESSRGAEAQRRDRLVAWRRDRAAAPGAGQAPAGPDRITGWLDRELARPLGQGESSTLMAVRLPRSEVKSVQRRGVTAARTLRLGWQLGFKDVEAMPLEELKDAIAGRGVTADGDVPISVDAMLPRGLETDAQWLLRRAATEVLNDEGLRFVRYGNMVLAEGGMQQQAPDPAAASAIVADTLKSLLDGGGIDPVPGKLREVAARGRVGAIVTRLDMAPDAGSVTVESALYVRGANGQWTRAAWRSGTLRTDEVTPAAAGAIAEDPMVKSAFGLFESIGFGQVSEEMRRKSLAVGATTKRAISIARTALNRDVSALALPLDEPRAPARAPNP